MTHAAAMATYLMIFPIIFSYKMLFTKRYTIFYLEAIENLFLFQNHADNGQLLVDFVFAWDDFAGDDIAVEFLDKEFELTAVKAKPNVTVRGAERFFLVLRQVKQGKRSTALEDTDRFLEGKARICCMMKHLAHENEVGKVIRKACLDHIGHLGRHVLDILLL